MARPEPPGQLKYRILQALVSYVYEAVDKRREEVLASIIKRNDVANNRELLIFSYAGKRWTQHRFRGLPKMPYLEENLHPEMDAYIAEGKLIEETEKPMVEAFIRAILNSETDPTLAMLNIPTALQRPITEAMEIAKEAHGLPADLDFESCQAKVGAYGPAADAIRKRMMFNMLVE